MSVYPKMIVALAVLSAAPAFGQTGTAQPDFSGLWKGTNPASSRFGQNLPFTAYGAERARQVDLAKDPSAICLPVGPTRGYFQLPFQIVQTKDSVVILFEYGRTYRLIYTDGRKPPADIHDYPEWMGFSTGRWEKDTLVVETIAIDERTWLDAGHEHSDKLRLTERLKKIGDDTIEWILTVDDQVFFTKPWNVTWLMRRAPRDDRIMSYSCHDNNQYQVPR